MDICCTKLGRALRFLAFAAAVPCALAGARTIQNLDGRWELAVGDERPAAFDRTAPVPGLLTMATPAPDLDVHGTENPEKYVLPWRSVWYRRTFNTSGPVGAAALLRVRARYNARVFLNGTELGHDPHASYSHGVFDATRALRTDRENELLVQVGTWETATWPSKERSPCWWRSSRSPGLWDTVTLEFAGSPRIEAVQILPCADLQSALARVTVSNDSVQAATFTLSGIVRPRAGGEAVGRQEAEVVLAAGEVRTVELAFACPGVTPWSAGREGTPALYSAVVTTRVGGREADATETVFGFRTVAVRGPDLLVNGRKTFLRAGNVVFNRAMIRWAPQVFDPGWVRRFLTLLRDEYGYNFLRLHLGHAPNFWYDIADEVGLMVEEQWRYFHDSDPQGEARAHTLAEFDRWVRENVNHPSIVIWDKQNEGDVEIPEIVAALRAYDPTRPWLEEDFDAAHVYQYSETDTDVILDAPSADRPSTVLESCRFWLNEWGLPERREAFKTVRTATAWNLHHYTVADAMRLQADLHADIGGFHRAGRFTAWAPFAVLSGPWNGQTFFLGDLGRGFEPKENLTVIRDLHETFGLTLEMWQAREWYRERKVYAPGSCAGKTVAIWNDGPAERAGTVVVRVHDSTGAVQSEERCDVRVPAGGCVRRPVAVRMPAREGIAHVRCELLDEQGRHAAFSPRRRFMVASTDRPELTGREAFGGRFRAEPGSVYFGDAYIGAPVPDAVRETVTRELAGLPIGAVTPRSGDGGGFRFEAGRSKERLVVEIAADGRVIRREGRVRVAYSELSSVVREGIKAALGLVPVDEVTITRRNERGATIYQVETVWQGQSRKVELDGDGRRLP